jgi:hypothetical protein
LVPLRLLMELRWSISNQWLNQQIIDQLRMVMVAGDRYGRQSCVIYCFRALCFR